MLVVDITVTAAATASAATTFDLTDTDTPRASMDRINPTKILVSVRRQFNSAALKS